MPPGGGAGASVSGFNMAPSVGLPSMSNVSAAVLPPHGLLASQGLNGSLGLHSAGLDGVSIVSGPSEVTAVMQVRVASVLVCVVGAQGGGMRSTHWQGCTALHCTDDSVRTVYTMFHWRLVPWARASVTSHLTCSHCVCLSQRASRTAVSYLGRHAHRLHRHSPTLLSEESLERVVSARCTKALGR